MSCPDWQSLCDRRDAGLGEVPGWRAALAHLEACQECEDEALAADPTLLFRRLPVVEVGESEVEAMQRAVRSMRRTASAPRPLAQRAWLRAAAVATVLLGAALINGLVSISTESAEPEVAHRETLAIDREITPVYSLPLVENVDPAYGPIIQVDDREISVVVVMPQGHGV